MNSTICKSANAPLDLTVSTRWPSSGPGERLQGPILQAVDTLFTWAERARQRRHLRTLNDHLLADIGLTDADVARETSKRFWQA